MLHVQRAIEIDAQTRCQKAGSVSMKFAARSQPALFTRMSIGPHALAQLSTACATAA